jgi:hypothetical protein
MYERNGREKVRCRTFTVTLLLVLYIFFSHKKDFLVYNLLVSTRFSHFYFLVLRT